MLAIDDVLRETLTPAQYQAAQDNSNEVLCLACAGSGKSLTLAYRTARLVAEGVDPKGIVAFTFTDKAAESIKQQIARALERVGIPPTTLGAMYVGTIHSYCQRVLRDMDARYRQFDVLDNNKLTLYLISRYPQLSLQRLRPRARNKSYFDTIKKAAEAWTTLNDEMLDIEDVAHQDPELGNVLANLRVAIDRDNFIDFSSMIRLVVEALEDGEPAALKSIAGLEHLMVDEYQDINPCEERLIRSLHQNSSSLFVVGDDDQAIYGWRGADVGNILEFQSRYPTASLHTLSFNFRSTKAIVEVADVFVTAELGAQRIGKNPAADDPPGPRDVRNVWFADRPEEAEWVAQRIAALIGTAYRESDGQIRGLTPGDFAILMRSTRVDEQDGTQRHSSFTEALERNGIDYTLEAGGGVFDRLQVRVLRDSFELLRDASPTREQAREYFDIVVSNIFPDADFELFAQVLSRWGSEIHAPAGGARQRVYPQQLVHDLLRAFRIADSNFDAATMSDLGIFSRMIQDVESVYVSVDSSRRFQEILNFLSQAAEAGYDTSTEQILQRPDAVTVSTVHRVKGLEFPCVFVCDVEARRFPGQRRRYDGWLPVGLLSAALNLGRYQSTPEQEARLFYTALTRSERYLYVSGAENLPGGRQIRKRSPYALRLTHPELSDDPTQLPEGLVSELQRARIDERVVPTSYSDIRYYLKCPKDYEFRKRFGFSPPIPELFGFGMTVHATVGKLHEQFQDVPPTGDEAEATVRETFHVKHVPPSSEPDERPGAYERARDSAARMVRSYVEEYADDFTRLRQVEAAFEIAADNAVISGTIDLLLREDLQGNILEAEVIDFKTVEGGDEPEVNEKLYWTELSLQVQLYAKGARDVLGENTRTGAVHLLRDGQRISVPVDDDAADRAVRNVEWAVRRILDGDFPMRPHPVKCGTCDFKALCRQTPEEFLIDEVPPTIRVPGPQGEIMQRSFSEFVGR